MLEQLRESDLLDAAAVAELATLPEAAAADPRALGRVLLQRKLLTKFQVNLVAQNRAKELRVGKYLLLDKLGEGGMGQVFKAQHSTMGRVVALKLIRKEKLANPDSVKRFYQEVQVAAQLNHPNIVTAYDVDQIGPTHYFAMEYVEGIDLARQVKTTGVLDVALACEYARQVAQGLQHAHEKGLIHRDIKPHNLLVTQADGKPLVKLLDMGLARLQNQGETGLTQTGQVLGTPDYLAPEQAFDSRKADIRSDIYSLGCTLYYLLSGRAPFTGETLTQVLLKHQMEEAPALTSLRAGLPPALYAVIKKMMAKSPDDRYQTPAKAATALEPFARGETGRVAVALPIPPASSVDSPTSNTWASLDDDPRVVSVPAAARASRSSTRIAQDEDEAPRRARGKERDPDEKPDNTLLYLMLGGLALLPVLAGMAALVLFMLWPASPPRDDGQAKRPTDKTATDKPAKTDKQAGDKQVDKDGKQADKDGDKGDPVPPALVKGSRELVPAHKQAVRGVAIAPNGEVAASVADGIIRVWDLKTGKSRSDLTDGNGFSPSLVFSSDSKRLLVGGPTRLFEWDMESRNRVGQDNRPGTYLSPDGKVALHLITQPEPAMVAVVEVATGVERGRFLASDVSLTGVNFSPNSKRATLVGSAGLVQLCDVEQARSLKVARADLGPLKQTAACCTTHATEVVIGFNTGTLGVLEMEAQRMSRPFRGQHSGPVTCLALAPSATQVASGAQDGTVRLWDLATGREVARYIGHTGAVNALAFTPDGERLVTGSEDMSVRVWELSKPSLVPEEGQPTVPDPTPPVQSFVGLTGWIGTVAISPDAKQILGQGTSGAILWDRESGKEIRRYQGHLSTTARMAVTRDWSKVVTASHDRTVRVYQLATGELLSKLEGHESHIHSVAISDDGKRVLTGSGRIGGNGFDDNSFRLFDLETGKELRKETGLTKAVQSVALTGDGKVALIGEMIGSWHAWDVENWKEIAKGEGNIGSFNRFAFLPGTSSAVMLRRRGTVDLLTLINGKTNFESLLETPFELRAVAVSGDGIRAAHVEIPMLTKAQPKPRGLIRIRDLVGRKVVAQVEAPSVIESVALSTDGRWLVGGDMAGTVRLWDLDKFTTRTPTPPVTPPAETPVVELKEIQRFAARRNNSPQGTFILPDAKQAIICDGESVQLWNVATGKPDITYSGRAGTPNGLTAVAVSRDGKRIITVASDDMLRVYDVQEANPVKSIAVGKAVTGVAISGDGKRAVTGSGHVPQNAAPTDCTFRVWDLDEGKELNQHTLTTPIRAVILSDDGKLGAFTHQNGNWEVWDVEGWKSRQTVPSPNKTPNAPRLAFVGPTAEVLSAPGRTMLERWDLAKGPPAELGKTLESTWATWLPAVSGDGQRAASAHGGPVSNQIREYALRVWNLSNNKELCSAPVHGPVQHMALSRDGRYLLACFVDGSRLYEVAEGAAPKTGTPTDVAKELQRVEIGVPVTALALSPDGNSLAVRGSTMTVLNTANLQRERRLIRPESEKASFTAIAFTPDSKHILTGSSDGKVSLHDGRTGERLRTFEESHGDRVTSLAISPDGTTAVSTSGSKKSDHVLRFWDMKSGKPVRTIEGQTGTVRSVRYSGDGKRLFTAETDYNLRLWDPVEFKQTKTTKLPKTVTGDIAVTHDGKRVVVHSSTSLVIWDVENRRPLHSITAPPNCHVYSTQFFDSDRYLAVGMGGYKTEDGRMVMVNGRPVPDACYVRIYDVESGSEVRRFGPHEELVRGAVVSPDGKRVYSGTFGRQVYVWDFAAVPKAVVKDPSKPERFSGHDTTLTALAVTNDGSRFLTGERNGNVRLWDASTGKLIRTYEGLRSEVRCVGFTANGALVSATDSLSRSRVWSTEKGDEVFPKGATVGSRFIGASSVIVPDGTKFILSQSRQVNIHSFTDKSGVPRMVSLGGSVRCMACPPSGNLLALGDSDGNVRSLDISTYKERAALPTHKGAVTAIAYSGKGQRIVTGGEDNVVVVRDVKTGIAKQMTGHEDAIVSVAITLDGRWVASASKDETVRIWNVGTGKESHRYGRGKGVVNAIAFDPKGKLLITAGEKITEYELPEGMGKP